LAVRLPHGTFISHSIPEYCDTAGFDAGIFEREIAYEECSSGRRFSVGLGTRLPALECQAFAHLVGRRF